MASSLAAITRALHAQVSVRSEAIDRLIAHLPTGSVRPQLFALYTDLVRAIDDDDSAAVATLVDALADPALLASPAARLGTLSDAFLGEGMADRYLRILADDTDTPLDLEPASADERERGVLLVEEARRLLARSAPALAGEIDVLARQIVLVGKPAGPLIFQGASTFYLWGCVFLNPSAFPTRIEMAEALTHETAHLLLFGMTGGNPLVENPDFDRHASPLRPDPRPMEGIVHATYVLARMMLCLDLLADGGDLDAAEQTSIAAARAENARLYQDGLRTVLKHARFTQTGARVFDDCLAHFPADRPS